MTSQNDAPPRRPSPGPPRPNRSRPTWKSVVVVAVALVIVWQLYHAFTNHKAGNIARSSQGSNSPAT